MKKYITIALCVLLLIVLAVPTFAAGETKIMVTPDKTVVQRGETVELAISISGEASFTSVVAELNYDANVFEYVSSAATSTGPMVDYDGVSIAILNMSGTKYEGDLLTITLRVKDTAPIDPSKVTGSASGNSGELAVQFVGTTVNINCEHAYSAYEKVDDEFHTRTCSKCKSVDKQAHKWDEGEFCPAPTCTEPGKEKFTCTDETCDATKIVDLDPKGHDWSKSCNVCANDPDHTRTDAHNYPDTMESDTTSHWYECADCHDRKDNEDHKPGPEATDTTAQICTVCEYVIKPAKEHVHKYGDEWVYDTDNHWHRCETKASPDCYVKDGVAPHEYSNDCDVSCNTCDYVRVAPHDFNSKLLGNVNGHYYKCTGADCDAVSEVEPHIPGEEATENTPQTCTECGFIIKMQLSHVHDFGETWHTDDKDHWKSCSDPQCPEMDAYAPHEWDEGVEVEGGYLYTCAVCAHQLTLTEQMGTEPTTPPTTAPSGNEPTQPAAPQNPGEPEEKGGIPWKWAGIAAIVLLIIGFILIIIEFIRSRKTNMHGKFSK